MRNLILMTLAVGMAAAAAPSSAQTYDPSYPFCKQVNSDASSIDCYYTSMEQCKEGIRGMSAVCIANPFYKGTPAPAAAPARPSR
jgi:hypothetical protein